MGQNQEVKAFHRLTAACAVHDVDPRSPAAFELTERGLLGVWIKTGEGAHHFATEQRFAQALANIQELGEQQCWQRDGNSQANVAEFDRLPPSADCWN